MENWSTLSTCQRALHFIGLWPEEKFLPLYVCRTAVILGLHAFYIIYFAVLPIWQGADKFLYSYSYVLIAVTALHRIIMILINKRHIVELCSALEQNYRSMEHDLDSSGFRKTCDSINSFCRRYLWSQCTILTFWCMGHVMSILYDFCVKGMPYFKIQKELPYGLNYPFDWKSSPQFELLLLFEILQLTAIMFSICISDCTLFTIIGHISGQLQALIIMIQKKTKICIESPSGHAYTSKKNTEETSNKINFDNAISEGATYGKYVKEKIFCNSENFLYRIIEHHNQIYRCADTFEEMFSIMLCIKFFVTTFFLCLTAYMISISLDSPGNICRAMSWALYESNILYNYCQLGEKLTSWSLKVNDALFYADWQDKSVAIQEMYWIMMVRAQRPIILKAGAFYTFSFRSFRKILESSYSYLMVMLQMNSQEFMTENTETLDYVT